MNTSIRFGGDGYNWKTRTAQWNCSTWSTLQALREARDRNSYLQILTNTRGIGTGNGSTLGLHRSNTRDTGRADRGLGVLLQQSCAEQAAGRYAQCPRAGGSGLDVLGDR